MRRKAKPTRPVAKFGRAILPPSRFHTGKRGAKGFVRPRDRPARAETREIVEQEWDPNA